MTAPTATLVLDYRGITADGPDADALPDLLLLEGSKGVIEPTAGRAMVDGQLRERLPIKVDVKDGTLRQLDSVTEAPITGPVVVLANGTNVAPTISYALTFDVVIKGGKNRKWTVYFEPQGGETVNLAERAISTVLPGGGEKVYTDLVAAAADVQNEIAAAQATLDSKVATATTEANRAKAEADRARDISNIDTSDGLVGALVNDPASASAQAVGRTTDTRAAQIDYVARLEAASSMRAIQLVKVDAGEHLQVVAHSPSGAYTAHLIDGTAATSGRDDYRIVGDIWTGKLPLKQLTYTDLTTTGTFSATAEQFGYTTQVGATWQATINVPFDGAEVRIYPYRDNRGGIWRVTLAGRVTDVSTFAATGAQDPNGALVSSASIPKGSHVLKAEFIGADPANPPSGGVARGWMARTPGSNTFPGTYELVKLPDRSGGWAAGTKVGVESNREFAWWIKRAGTAQTATWVPFHTVPSAFAATPARFFDGDRELSVFRMSAGEAICLTGPFRMVQHVYGRHPDDPTVNLLDIWTTTTIHPSGRMTIEGSIRVLFDIEVTNTYVIMNPVASSVFDLVVSSVGNAYPNTAAQEGTNTWLSESDWGESYVFLSSASPDLAAAHRYNMPVETTRRGGGNKNSAGTRTWLEHRTGRTILKHYTKLWATGAVVPAGTVLRFSGDYMHLTVPNAYGQLAR